MGRRVSTGGWLRPGVGQAVDKDVVPLDLEGPEKVLGIATGIRQVCG